MGHSDNALADPVKRLQRIPATDVKRRGWRGVMRTLGAQGPLLVTNHDQPEAVIVAAEEYAQLLNKAQRADSRIEADLVLLRRRFDERLATLREPAAADRLRSVMRGPARLRGKVKAGRK